MTKAAGGGNQGYNLANAAMYMGSGASKTHTNGFSFHPPPGHSHKYANSIFSTFWIFFSERKNFINQLLVNIIGNGRH